jgi:hypothetical protein
MGNYAPISLNEALQAMPNIYMYVLNYCLNCDIAETLNVQIFWCMPMDL